MNNQNKSYWYTPPISLTSKELKELHKAFYFVLNLFGNIGVNIVFRRIGMRLPIMPGTISTAPTQNFELPHTQYAFMPNNLKGTKMIPTMVVITTNLHHGFAANLLRNYSTLVHEYGHCVRMLNNEVIKNKEGFSNFVEEEKELAHWEMKFFKDELTPNLANKLIEFNKKTLLGFLGHLNKTAESLFMPPQENPQEKPTADKIKVAKQVSCQS